MQGSVCGMLTTFVVMICLIVGNTVASNRAQLPNQRLVLNTYGCDGSNETTSSSTMESFVITTHPNWKDQDDSFLIQLLSISYMWYSGIGCICTVFFGIIYSYLFQVLGKNDELDQRVPSQCISPPVLRFWKWAQIGRAHV